MVSNRPPIHEFRDRVRAREKLLGIFIKSCDSASIEIIGMRTDLDFVALDLEHSSYTYRELHSCILAARSCSLPVVVRVASSNSEYVSQSLDGGASGVMFPRISGPDEAEYAIGQTRFENGTRGFSLSHRAAQYGSLTEEQFVKRNDGNILRAVQIEDAEGVNEAERIATTNDVDLIFVGPADLGLALKASAKKANELEMHIAEVGQSSLRAGTAAGIYLSSAASLEDYIGLGFSVFVMSTDQAILAAGVNSLITEFRRQI